MQTCDKCKRKYTSTRSASNCPYCSERETQVITAADVDTGSVLGAILDAIVDSASDVGSAVGDAFEGGGGDFGGGGASGDW